MSDTAYLSYGPRRYFATAPTASAWSPDTAITRLIQGIYETEPKMARKIVRARIFGTAEPTERDRGMIKIAAKRFGRIEPAEARAAIEGHEDRIDLTNVKMAPESQLADDFDPLSLDDGSRDWMRLAFALAGTARRDAPELYGRDRAVGALLIGPGEKILAWGVNSNAMNRTLHAELNLVRRLHRRTGKRIPLGSRVYVTLKPCRMCAGQIWDAAEDPAGLQVYYGEDDPGPGARGTILDRHFITHQIKTSESEKLG